MRQYFRCLLAVAAASAVCCDSDPRSPDAASDPDTGSDVDAAEELDAGAQDDADVVADADAGDAEMHTPRDAGNEAEAAVPPTCDAVAPTSCPMPAPGYDDVVPILEMRCLSCHDGLGDQWPLTSYDHVVSWTAEIRGMMLDCSMPPPDSGIAMPLDERQLLLTWLRCGSPP